MAWVVDVVGVPVDEALHVYVCTYWNHHRGDPAGVPVHVDLCVYLVQVTGRTGDGHVVVEVQSQITVASEDGLALVPACSGCADAGP